MEESRFTLMFQTVGEVKRFFASFEDDMVIQDRDGLAWCFEYVLPVEGDAYFEVK